MNKVKSWLLAGICVLGLSSCDDTPPIQHIKVCSAEGISYVLDVETNKLTPGDTVKLDITTEYIDVDPWNKQFDTNDHVLRIEKGINTGFADGQDYKKTIGKIANSLNEVNTRINHRVQKAVVQD